MSHYLNTCVKHAACITYALSVCKKKQTADYFLPDTTKMTKRTQHLRSTFAAMFYRTSSLGLVAKFPIDTGTARTQSPFTGLVIPP